jgi:uncharacterized protein (DUF3084 family)
MLEPVTQLAAKAWIESFKLAPKFTAAMTIIIGSMAVAAATYALYSDSQRERQPVVQNESYVKQIDRLRQTEDNVKSLLTFVEAEKRRLADSENVVALLKAEEERLHPIVQTDRQVVDAILAVQAEHQSRNVWRERWIGFGLGVVASIVAAIVFETIRMLHRRITVRTTPPTASTEPQV